MSPLPKTSDTDHSFFENGKIKKGQHEAGPECGFEVDRAVGNSETKAGPIRSLMKVVPRGCWPNNPNFRRYCVSLDLDHSILFASIHAAPWFRDSRFDPVQLQLL